MSKLWGGRFSAEADQALRALNDSIQFDLAFYAVDIAGSRAYARALERAGLLTPAEAQAIGEGLQIVLEEFESGKFELHPGDEDIHTAVERRLTELIGAPAAKLHTGRSRNDQVATDLRLWLGAACRRLDGLIAEVQTVMVTQAEVGLEVPMPGYTHFQPAQPLSLGQWWMSFFWMLARDRDRLADCGRRLNRSPLGSGALSGTPYAIDREALAADLGLGGVTQNSLDAVSDRDGAAEFLFICALLGTHLSRLAEDVILYANPAMGFVKLPDAYSTGSSLMPQKRNPDPMELARGKSGRLIGHLAGFLTTLKGLPSGYNKDLQEDKEPLFDAMTTLERLLTVLAGMLAALEFVPAKLRAALDETMLATELADYLVAKGLPFREAHHVVGGVVRRAEMTGQTLSTLPLGDYQALSPLFGEDVYGWLNFEAAIAKRAATGGTSPVAVAAQIAQAKLILGEG
jgi:argininosuccinate lyase